MREICEGNILGVKYEPVLGGVMFDPDKVTLHLTGWCDCEKEWEYGTPMPKGWGETPEDVRRFAWVTTQDYDQLLAMYKAERARAEDYSIDSGGYLDSYHPLCLR